MTRDGGREGIMGLRICAAVEFSSVQLEVEGEGLEIYESTIQLNFFELIWF